MAALPLVIALALLVSVVVSVPGAAPASTPTISAGSGSVVAGATQSRTLLIPVTLSEPSTTSISVVYAVSDGTARRGIDYTSVWGTIAFNATSTHVTPVVRYVRVPVFANPNLHDTLTVTLSLWNPKGATLAVASALSQILANPAGSNGVSASIGDITLYRGVAGAARVALLPFTLSRAASVGVTVGYQISPMNLAAGTDFVAPTTGSIVVAAGALQKQLRIPIEPDPPPSADSGALIVAITGVSAGAVVGRPYGIVVVNPESTQLAPAASSALFDDEFDGSALDTSKWQPNWLGNTNATITKPVHSAEASCYDPSQVSVSGGYLHLKAAARSCKANNGVTYSYASGLVNSKTHFTYTYGYMEARVWLPGTAAGISNWPALWADGTGTWPSTGELDVMEGLAGKPCYHFHSPSGGPGGCANIGNPSGWHTFGADWRPGVVTYYYDGVQVGRITSGVTGAPMYLIANLGVSSTISGPITTPSEMLVDYIRVYP